MNPSPPDHRHEPPGPPAPSVPPLDAWSIADGYHDTAERWHATSPEARAAFRSSMGAGQWGSPPPAPPLWFVPAGSSPTLQTPGDVYLDDGTLLTGLRALPPDLPPGHHVLRPLDGGPTTRLVVHPPVAPLPGRAWAWAVQLYAVRSRASWGIGDLADLRELARWSHGLGAGALALSPLHAPTPVEPIQDSPYFASSRIFRNPVHLRVEEVPGAGVLGAPRLEQLAAAGRALNALRVIDRTTIYRLKSEALDVVFAWFDSGGAPTEEREAFERWVAGEARLLQRFATFCALAETNGSGWRSWPAAYRHPLSTEVADFARSHAHRVRFHMWVQWLLDRQLAAAAAAGVPLVGDLAVGFDGGGADGWMFQDTLALDCKVGAPPDDFNTQGQDWGLPPFVPWKLRAAHYEPLLATLRAAFRHVGGLRIDHVMGLFRLFWIHESLPVTQGTYVYYPWQELLGLVTLEAHRAGAFVVGEDLGTVPPGMREALGAAGVLSYRLAWFEERSPATYPERALAAVTTHDLPTVAGVWTGADRAELAALAAQAAQAAGDAGDAGDAGNTGDAGDTNDDRLRSALTTLTGCPPDAPVGDVVLGVHRALAAAPSLLVAATLDDALGVEERPNVPGTVDERPNWRLALPVPLEALTTHPTVLAVAEVLAAGRATVPPPTEEPPTPEG